MATDTTNRWGTSSPARASRSAIARDLMNGSVKAPRTKPLRREDGSKTMTGKFKPMLGSMEKTLRVGPMSSASRANTSAGRMPRAVPAQVTRVRSR